MESLTFHDPDDEDDLILGAGDTQGEDFKFAFTLPTQQSQQAPGSTQDAPGGVPGAAGMGPFNGSRGDHCKVA